MGNLRKITMVLFTGCLCVSCASCGDSGPGAAYYGDQGGEKVLRADGNGKNPLRARKDQAFFKLKNARKGARKFGKESLSVDWEEVKTGERPREIFVVVKPVNEKLQEVDFRIDHHEKQGTITLEVAFGAGSMADVPTNVEFYLATRSNALSDLSFKLSNSVTLGTAEYTYARNWTQQETDRIAKVVGPPPSASAIAASNPAPTAPANTQAPPAVGTSPGGGAQPSGMPPGAFPGGRGPGTVAPPGFPASGFPPPGVVAEGFPPPGSAPPATGPQLPADVGQDTEWVGNTSGGSPQRRGEKYKPLLGFNYAIGNWAGGPCLSTLIPIYSADPPTGDHKQVVAKPGYAVAGLEVHADKVVRGVQVIFMKQNADGTLNSSDSYLSEVAGATTSSPRKLGGDGRRMLGIHVRQGLIIDAIAAVMQSP